ncbi:HPr kinase/phosphorylase [Sphingomonas sanguinis]|uniref:Aldolase n=1 Tax=Sphingomonas sanguinis TaxID=33051 RepID=A0A147J3A4_9SPHN|nr:HPr kinase/phosphatase C-terminal domain-containing protein [Sphingomonas sanguinis]KTW03340.1 aldolase [Sphingomonas sanguinis]
MTGPQEPELIHATAVAIGETGVLLLGPSGAGKSDLALRLIDRGATLIGDDYLHARQVDGSLQVVVPDRIAGRIEVRGVGIMPLPHRPTATIGLAIRLVSEIEGEERLPEPRETVIAGVTIPVYSLVPLPASAPIKVELLVSCLKERP